MLFNAAMHACKKKKAKDTIGHIEHGVYPFYLT